MTYLEKPRWIDDEDQDRPFPLVLKPTREEEETAIQVIPAGRDEFMEYPAVFPGHADDTDIPDDRVLVARPDPLLDEPEWGTAKEQPDTDTKKGSVQLTLDTEPEPGPGIPPTSRRKRSA